MSCRDNHKIFKNILIIGHSNIGDVCYDLVVVNPLRRQFPAAKISFLVSSRSENLIQDYQGLDRIFIFDVRTKHKDLFRRLRLVSALVREKFDLVLVLKNTLMHKFLGIPCAWSVRKYLRREPHEVKMHVADIYLGLLRFHGIAADEVIFGFNLEKENEFCNNFFAQENISIKDRVVGIFPIAAWALKSWPIDRWNKLTEILKAQYGIKVIALGKSINDSFCKAVLSHMSTEIISAVDKTTLKQAMALIKRCSLFIGPDSSLLHLASCMKVEVIGLYGPTSSEYLYPYFHRQNVIVSQKTLECMPCYPRLKPCLHRNKSGYSSCMEGISVEDVLQLVKQKLIL